MIVFCKDYNNVLYVEEFTVTNLFHQERPLQASPGASSPEGQIESWPGLVFARVDKLQVRLRRLFLYPVLDWLRDFVISHVVTDHIREEGLEAEDLIPPS